MLEHIQKAIDQWPKTLWLDVQNGNPISIANRLREARRNSTLNIPKDMTIGVSGQRVYIGPRNGTGATPTTTEAHLIRPVVSPPLEVFAAICWLHANRYLQKETLVVDAKFDLHCVAQAYDVHLTPLSPTSATVV